MWSCWPKDFINLLSVEKYFIRRDHTSIPHYWVTHCIKPLQIQWYIIYQGYRLQLMIERISLSFLPLKNESNVRDKENLCKCRKNKTWLHLDPWPRVIALHFISSISFANVMWVLVHGAANLKINYRYRNHISTDIILPCLVMHL